MDSDAQSSCARPSSSSKVGSLTQKKPPHAAKRRGSGDVVQQTTLAFEHNTAIAPAKGLPASVPITPLLPRVSPWWLNAGLGENDNWVSVGLLRGEHR
jgi:hypothetical protein